MTTASPLRPASRKLLALVRQPPSRPVLAAVVVLLAVTLLAPLWATLMEAPQYKGEEALRVSVYAGRIVGDVHEIETLNQYVGVHLPLDTPELAAAPWVLGALLAVALIALVQPERRRRIAAIVLATLMTGTALGALGLLQYRLYLMGHERDRGVFAGVEDFTPPVLGSAKIANFTVHMSLGAGSVAYVAALFLIGWLVVARPGRRRGEGSREAVPSPSQPTGGPENGMRSGGAIGRPFIALVAGIAVLLVLFAGGMVLIPRYQAAHPASELQRSDADQVRLDDLYLDVTLVTPEFLRDRKLERYLGDRDPERVLPLLVGLNTHNGDIGHMHHVPGELTLVGPDGHRYPAVTEPIVLSQHHNAYMMLFPAFDQGGRRFLEMEEGTLAVEAEGMGQRPVRRFEWQLPVARSAGVEAASGLVSRLMLGVVLISALLVVLSPCALELTLYYAAIISCTVTEGERAAMSMAPGSADTAGGGGRSGRFHDLHRAGRRRVLINLASFVGGFTLLYAASGATVGLIGAGVRQPLGPYSGTIQIVGGSLILFFALRVAGAGAWLRAGWARLVAATPALRTVTMRLRRGGPSSSGPRFLGIRRSLFALRMRGQRRAKSGAGMRARDSFLVGMGLSSACLSCMGGAVLYPLLVYAGLTSWYSGLITLTLYSLGIALPMVFIALGFFRIHMSLHRKMSFNRVLRMTSAAMLGSIALLILTGRERVITDFAFRFLAGVSGWGA